MNLNLAQKQPDSMRAYTLIELLITLSLAVILLGIALPAFANLLRRVQSDTVIFSVANTYQLARTSAINHRQPVVFCARASATTCGGDWNKGALVFVDPDNNRVISGDETLLSDMPAPPTGSQLRMKAALGKQYLRFMNNGMLENTAGSISYCPPEGSARDARTVIFTRNGRLRFGSDRNQDGIQENAEGQPLSCPP